MAPTVLADAAAQAPVSPACFVVGLSIPVFISALVALASGLLFALTAGLGLGGGGRGLVTALPVGLGGAARKRPPGPGAPRDPRCARVCGGCRRRPGQGPRPSTNPVRTAGERPHAHRVPRFESMKASPRWLVSKWVAGHRARGRAGSVFRDPRDIAHIPQRSREAEAAEIVREGP